MKTYEIFIQHEDDWELFFSVRTTSFEKVMWLAIIMKSEELLKYFFGDEVSCTGM